MSCDCGNKKKWRNMQVTSAGITATCGKCGEQVGTVGQPTVSKTVAIDQDDS